jgi:hypothetical protein
MRWSSLRPDTFRLAAVVLPALAAAFVSGCFNSPDKSKLSCTTSDHCPGGEVWLGVNGTVPGICGKPIDGGGVDSSSTLDGVSGIDAGSFVDLALDGRVLDTQSESIADVPLTTGPDSEIDSASSLDVAASAGGTTGTGGVGVTGRDGATASGGDTGTVDVGTGGATGAGGATGTGGSATVNCTTSSQCNDGNPCTDDTCDATGTCRNTANDANSCADASGCLTATHCVGGVCSGTAVTDGTHCGAHSCVGLSWTTETCVGGRCVGSALDTNCDDSNLCTGDTCNSTTGCSHSPVTCTAPDLCHTASCSPSGGCTYTEKTCTPDACHTTATCNLSTGACEQGTVKLCTPDACHTTASCNPSTGACEQGTAIACSPDACHTTATCNPSTGCQQGTAATNGTLCGNGAYCSGTVRKKQMCQSGVCKDGEIGDCAVANTACTSYTCQVVASSVTCASNINEGASCPAPDVCWQIGVCRFDGTCVGGTPLPDGTACPSPFVGGVWYGSCQGAGGLDWYEYRCKGAICRNDDLTYTCTTAYCHDNVQGGCTNTPS